MQFLDPYDDDNRKKKTLLSQRLPPLDGVITKLPDQRRLSEQVGAGVQVRPGLGGRGGRHEAGAHAQRGARGAKPQARQRGVRLQLQPHQPAPRPVHLVHGRQLLSDNTTL